MAIFEEVKEIITKYIKIDADKITLESRLNEDLDADSIDVADVVMDIEEKYGFEFFWWRRRKYRSNQRLSKSYRRKKIKINKLLEFYR